MNRSAFFDLLSRHRKVAFFVLFWCFGLFIGALSAVFTDPFFHSGMRGAAVCRISIPGSFIAAVFPFLVAAYAAQAARPNWIYPIAFAKAFALSYIGLLIHISFGSAGWLVRCFLQFSGIVAAPVFCWFGIRQLTAKQGGAMRDLVVSCILMAAIVAVDYFLVSPLLLHLTVI